MIYTYKNKLESIEILYDQKDFNGVILKTSKLIENALTFLFHHFHNSLKTKKDNLKYLEFERKNGEKYFQFLKAPTIGVSIGYINQLLKDFKDHPRLKTEIRSYLDKINEIRNANIHAGKGSATEEDAATIIDYSEKFLKVVGLHNSSTEPIGFPLKYYLVYRSITAKFKTAKDDDDLRKIAEDALVVLPELLDIYINKQYNFLTLDQKETFINKLVQIVDKKNQNKIEFYYQLFLQIDLFDKKIDDLKHGLEEISEYQKDKTINRRRSRHYVNVLDILVEDLMNKKTVSLLEYSDTVKRKYLEGHKLSSNDRIILEEKRNELAISDEIADLIENKVIATIEKDLILYQTLEHRTISSSGATQIQDIKKKKLSRVLIPASGLVLVIIILLFVFKPAFLFEDGNGMPSYEKDYYDGNFLEGYSKSMEHLDIDNQRANYFHILLTSIVADLYNEDKSFNEARLDYFRQLAKNYPDSAKSHFYLSLAFMSLGDHEGFAHDSAWISLKKAEVLKASGEIFDLIKWQVYDDIGSNQMQLEAASELFEKYPNGTRSQRAAGATFFEEQDTTKAIIAFQNSINSYKGYSTPYGLLANIYQQKKEYDSAMHYAQLALDVSPHNSNAMTTFASVLKAQGRYEEAKEFLYEQLNDPKNESPSIYFNLIEFLVDQDSLDRAFELSEIALDKFPDNSDIKSIRDVMNDRKNQIIENRALAEDILPWNDDFEQATETASSNEMPILVEFNWSFSWNSKRLDRWIYPDSVIQELLKKFILVKLNIDAEKALVDKYKIKDEEILVLAPDGEVVLKIPVDEVSEEVDKAREYLNKGLISFNRHNESKKIIGDAFTSVSNFEGALIIAKNRNLPILTIVGNTASEWTNNLVEKSLKNPSFKADFKDIIYVYINSEQAKKHKEWDIETFPTTLFFTPDGKLWEKLVGYQTAEILADKISILKTPENRNSHNPGINWIHNLEEAKAIAIVSRRDIVVQVGPDLRDIYSNQELIDLSNSDFVFAKLSREDTELKKELPFDWFPNGQYYFSQSGKYLKQGNYDDDEAFKVWLLDNGEQELMSVMGPKNYYTYSDKCRKAELLKRQRCYYSSIALFEELIEEGPSYSKNYMSVGDIYLNDLKSFKKAISYYEEGFRRGEKITENKLLGLIYAYQGIEDIESLKPKLNRLLESSEINLNTKSEIHRQYSYLFHIVEDFSKAIDQAKMAVQLRNNYKNNLQLGKVYFHAAKYAQAKDQLIAATKKEETEPSEAYLYLSLLADSIDDQPNSKIFYDLAFETSENLMDIEWYEIPNFYGFPGLVKMIEFDLRSRIKLFPKSRPYYKEELAIFNVFFNVNLSEASDLIVQHINEDPAPDWSYVYPTQAWIQFELGQTKQANETIDKLRDMISADWLDDNFLALYVFALQAKHAGDNEKAHHYYHKIVNYDKIMWLSAAELKLQQEVREMLEAESSSVSSSD